MREFNFKKSYEEIKINGKDYTIDFSDEAILQYQKKFNVYHKKYQTLKAKEEDSTDYYDEAKVLMTDIVDGILGEGKFDALYMESGKSLYNMSELILFLSDILGEKVESVREKNKQKYVRK